MADILTNIGLVFAECVDYLGDVLDVVTGNPVLLITVVAVPVISFAFGITKRLLNF